MAPDTSMCTLWVQVVCFDLPSWDILPSESLTHFGNSFLFFLKKKSTVAKDGGVGRADKKNLGQKDFFSSPLDISGVPQREEGKRKGEKPKDGRKEG